MWSIQWSGRWDASISRAVALPGKPPPSSFPFLPSLIHQANSGECSDAAQGPIKKSCHLPAGHGLIGAEHARAAAHGDVGDVDRFDLVFED